MSSFNFLLNPSSNSISYGFTECNPRSLLLWCSNSRRVHMASYFLQHIHSCNLTLFDESLGWIEWLNLWCVKQRCSFLATFKLWTKVHLFWSKSTFVDCYFLCIILISSHAIFMLFPFSYAPFSQLFTFGREETIILKFPELKVNWS